MQAIQWLIEFEFARLALITGVAVGLVCSLLSVIVVVRRMAFVGQGVSHAGFGGVGMAAFFGIGGLAQDAVVFVFCLGAALAIGRLTERRRVDADSAIGIVLVAAMAWGVLLMQVRSALLSQPWYASRFATDAPPASAEMLLSGSLLQVTPSQTVAAVVISLLVLLIAGLLMKELIFYAFDPVGARAFGVPTRMIHYLLLVMLALVIVLSIRLVGFVLVSALLVLPAATAMQWTRKLGPTLIISAIVGVGCVAAGLLTSLEIGDIAAGPCIVAALLLAFCVSLMARREPIGPQTLD